MLRVAVLGCGRIGRMHAANVARHPRTTLSMVYDIDSAAANEVAQREGARVGRSPEDVFGSSDVDAVLIATATPTHADYIEMAAAAGKAALCEKPIDLDLQRVALCRRRIAGSNAPVQIGFNRRFDPGHKAARDAVRAGEIGALHQVIITSRDPALPPRGYLTQAGGLLRDMTIHDFDLARFMLDEEPVEVFAMAGALVDPALGAELSEVDSAMILLRTASGKQCHINNIRCAVYGYDQRVELVGQSGMIISDNRKPHEVKRFAANRTEMAEPYLLFFLERYNEAFVAEIDAFVDAVEAGRTPSPSVEDGLRALVLAEAAYRSLREGRIVRVQEFED
jgi:myo-inositol 2-dehydrogenase / D-chiro-inositol 1-dehydrogenase